jgi:hypothetical protein
MKFFIFYFLFFYFILFLLFMNTKIIGCTTVLLPWFAGELEPLVPRSSHPRHISINADHCRHQTLTPGRHHHQLTIASARLILPHCAARTSVPLHVATMVFSAIMSDKASCSPSQPTPIENPLP